MARERRSQSAIVGAVIIALVMFASLLTALYIMNQYGSYARLSYEKSTILTEASELQRSTYAWYSYSYSPNGTLDEIVIAVSSGYPYSYEVSAVVIALPNGQTIILGPGAHPGVMEVYTAYGAQDWLPASAPAGGNLSIVVYIGQFVQAVSVVVQSGYAVTSVPAVYSLVAEAYYSPLNTNATSVTYYEPPRNVVNMTLLGRRIICQANITLYNPGPLPVTDFTLNLTLNLSNTLIKTCAQTEYINFTRTYAPLSNMIFAYLGPKGLIPMYTWIEAYNSSIADVWVKVPPSLVVLSHSYQTIYLLFLNTSLLGSGYLGINSYYTGFPLYDNIGNVMARGLLVQVYRDYSRPPSLLVNSSGMQKYLATLYRDGCTVVYPEGLYSWIYGLPMDSVTLTFSTNTICPSVSASMPSNASGTFYSQLPAPINSGFQNYEWVLLVLNGHLYFILGADVLFNWSSVPTGQTEWPGNVSAIYGNFVMKAIGWLSVAQWPTSSSVYLAVSADDYAAITVAPTVSTWLTSSYVDWISGLPTYALHVSYSNLSVWGSSLYSQSSGRGSSGGYSVVDLTGPDSGLLVPYSNAIPVSTIESDVGGNLGDYRAVIVYAQVNPGPASGFNPYDDDTYLAVFFYQGSGTSQPSTVAYPAPQIYWYSPMYPQDGVMPYLYCSVQYLLVLRGQPLLPSPPAPTPSVPGYGWIVA